MFDLAEPSSAWFANYAALDRSRGSAAVVEFAERYWHGRSAGGAPLCFRGFLPDRLGHRPARSPIRTRGAALKFLAFAVLITVVTYAIDRFTGLGVSVFFGIIRMFALGTLIGSGASEALGQRRLPVCRRVGGRRLRRPSPWKNVPVYGSAYLANAIPIMLGTAAFGADHFGIPPYTGVIMIGTVIGNQFYRSRRSLLPKLDGA
ncbi:MAG: heparan-alpha-glucosaminide N-acetyltransferase domain-containing protein [Bacillus subtilis]|nr:heparan-alpha-glucosaminide N-acetyltransferase domain-containing protein [Bacillus subtilis]